MAKPITSGNYYDLVNLNHALNKAMLKDKNIQFRYLKGFVNQKIALFRYKGIEDILPLDNLEELITFNNHLCGYNSNVYGTVICKYIDKGELDLYGIPTKVDLISFTGQPIAYDVLFKDIVLIRDNILDIPPITYLTEYIEKMQSIEGTLFSNLELLKLPATFTMNKKLMSSFNKMIENAINLRPIALADDSIVDSFKQFDINFPVQPESLLELWKNYRNFTLQSIGISGSDTQKRERLLVGEVQSQEEYTDFTYEEMKYMRQQFVEDMNNKLGSHIELVEMRKEYVEEKIEETAEQNRLTMGIQNNNENGGENNEDGTSDE